MLKQKESLYDSFIINYIGRLLDKFQFVGERMKKQIAYIISSCRILFSICLLFCPVFSVNFYTFYLSCGISDMIDGTVARKTGSVSEFGSQLDTASDIVFFVASFIKLLPIISISKWLWVWIIVIAIIKISIMVSGVVYKKNSFTAQYNE